MLFYKDPEFREMNIRLSDAEYEQAMLAFPILCADVVFINRKKRIFYLADRIVHPVKGWWWIGGRVYRGEEATRAAIRKICQETSLVLSPERLMFITFIRHFSAIRQQHPQELGSDTIAFNFATEVSEEEIAIASTGLDPKEYRPGSLTPFTRERIKAECRQQIQDLYALVFP